MYGIPYRQVHDADIQPEAPILHIPDILPDTGLHLGQFLRFTTTTRYLSPTRDTRFDKVTDHVFIYQFGILLRMLQHVRTGTHYRHIPSQYVDKLRQLIDTAFTKKITEFRLARVVLRSLQRIALGVHLHTAEFIAVKLLSAQTVTFLLKENRTRRGGFGDNPYDEIDKRKQRTQEQQGANHIEHTLDETVQRLAQGLLADIQDRHLANEPHTHRAAKIVTHIGNTVETD